MATGKGNNYLIAIIIVAIIVIILAIAIPAYHSSQVHKHLNAALNAAAPAKLVVEEAAVVHGGDLSQLKADELHWNQKAIANDPYVAGIKMLDGGRIRVATHNTGSNPDPVFLLTPTMKTGAATIEWRCSVAQGNASTLPDACSTTTKTADKPPATSASAPAMNTSAPTGAVSTAQPDGEHSTGA